MRIGYETQHEPVNNKYPQEGLNSQRKPNYLLEMPYNIDSILEQIGDRAAVVDACLPPQLVTYLRSNGVYAAWVPSVLGDGASDEQIENELLIGFWRSNVPRDRVLLTRDVKFSKRLRERAILVRCRKTLAINREGFKL